MGRRGDGGNPLLMARKRPRNPNMRPRRRREIGLQALDELWRLYQPPPGSRLREIPLAFRKVEAAARDIGIARRRFRGRGRTRCCSGCDDRDDAVPW